MLRAVARGLLTPVLVTPGGHRRFGVQEVEAFAEGLHIRCSILGLLSTGEAARLFGVSQPTLNRAVRGGRLNPAQVTPGGHRRFDRAALSASLFIRAEHGRLMEGEASNAASSGELEATA